VVLSGLANRTASSIRVKKGFSVGVVLTVPPFPYPDGYDELGRGTPICFRESMTDEDHASLHFGEVTKRDGQLTTAGMIGYTMVVTGIGATIEEARTVAYDRVDKIVIPNARYRKDIGVRLMSGDWARLKKLGWVE
jgi:phosphoribosylamine--glycine ligase